MAELILIAILFLAYPVVEITDKYWRRKYFIKK